LTKKSVIDIKDAVEVLGEEGIEEILDKDWKTAELPSTEELNNESHDSPMARNNPNSRANLVQYNNNKSKETKQKIISGLKFKSKRPDLDLIAFFDGSLEEHHIELIVPMREALADEGEEKLFFGIVKQVVCDFPPGELSTLDVDDICNLALNKILELRLLKLAKKSPKMVLDAASSIERFRKNSEKLKMALAARRMDRVDTKNKQSYSIVDLAVAFNEDKKKRLEEKADSLKKAQDKFKDSKLIEKNDTFGDK